MDFLLYMFNLILQSAEELLLKTKIGFFSINVVLYMIPFERDVLWGSMTIFLN
jgi:hypothetical protein